MRIFFRHVFPVLCIIILLFLWLVPSIVERDMNLVREHEPYSVSKNAAALHQTLLIGDMHADSLLWSRNLRKHSSFGQVDFPRLQKGNVGIQVFSAVTKSPRNLNYERNEAEAADNITLLAMVQLWPYDTWKSLTERALYQAEKLAELEQQIPEQVKLVRDRDDLSLVLEQREQGNPVIASLLATEGSHALDGKLANIRRLYDAGYRIMGLQHFFDNKLGGSLHGITGDGLTAFGRAAVTLMNDMGIVIDMAHSSPQVVREVLAMQLRPVIVSHTGMKGLCDTRRNISDELMKAIASQGGLIGIGYWEEASCDISPQGVANMIAYAMDTVGVDHVALGSDFDGAVETAMDTSELAALTQALLDKGLTEQEIRKVMGENLRDFLLRWLPAA